MENVWYDPSLKSVVGVFKGLLSIERHKEIAQEILCLAMEKEASKVIIDASYLMVIMPETSEWIISEWFPMAYKQGIKHMVFTKAKSRFSVISIHNVNHKAKGICISYVDSLTDIEGLTVKHKRNSRILI